MSDQQHRFMERTRIRLDDEYEVHYWMETFGVSRERLHELVAQYGTCVTAVWQALRPAA